MLHSIHLSTTILNDILQIANRLVQRVSSEGYSFTTPDNVKLSVSDARIKQAFVVVEPRKLMCFINTIHQL